MGNWIYSTEEQCAEVGQLFDRAVAKRMILVDDNEAAMPSPEAVNAARIRTQHLVTARVIPMCQDIDLVGPMGQCVQIVMPRVTLTETSECGDFRLYHLSNAGVLTDMAICLPAQRELLRRFLETK